jgi:hypothetical protein
MGRSDSKDPTATRASPQRDDDGASTVDADVSRRRVEAFRARFIT